MKRADEKLFLKAYDELADAVFRHCYFRTYDRDKAKDIAQEAFMRVWNYLAQGKKIDNIRAFVFRTATNLIIDDVRKKKNRPSNSLEEMHDAGVDITGTGAAEIETYGDANIMIKLMEQLDSTYRDIIMMRYMEGLTPREISEITGESANIISVRLNRGLKKMREILKYQAANS